MKVLVRNAVVSALALVAILVTGVVLSPTGHASSTIPQPTPYPSGWTFQKKSLNWSVAEMDLPSHVYVINILPTEWPVSSAVGFIDQYTTGTAHLVKKCPQGALRCVTLRAGVVKGGSSAAIGYTTCIRWKCTVTVDLKDARRSGQFNYATRKWLLVHELGHTYGLEHRASCKTSMYQYRRCAWYRTPPLKFDSAQKAILRQR